MSICPESRDDTHRTSMKIVQFSRLDIPLVNIRPIFSRPLDPGRPISNELHPSITSPPPPSPTIPPPFPNDNHSIKKT